MSIVHKPRVFLSHSKKDIDFIRRLDVDLRSANCDTWIDEVELRPGQPWMDQIFSSGIPSCEVVFCYLTNNSISSKVFKQEMDARLLERLSNERVGLLVYTESEDLRSQLRLDVQRLQIPEFNESNYEKILPRLVAEIWRFHAESLVVSAVQSEKIKRLEAEMRLQRLESNTPAEIFSPSESAEFAMIWSQIDKDIEITAIVTKKNKNSPSRNVVDHHIPPDPQVDDERKSYIFSVGLGMLFRLVIAHQKYEPSIHHVKYQLQKSISSRLNLESNEHEVSVEIPLDFEAILLRYGLVQRQALPIPISSDSKSFLFRSRTTYNLFFSTKFDRFCFWLDCNFSALEGKEIHLTQVL